MKLTYEKQTVSVVRWVARVVGVLVVIEVAAFAIGEGTSAHLREMLLTIAMVAMPTGVLVAWKWEGLGSFLTLAGLAAFVLVNGRIHGSLLGYATNPIFGPFLLAGLLFLFCWSRTRRG
jgi:hypothetical protein